MCLLDGVTANKEILLKGMIGGRKYKNVTPKLKSLVPDGMWN